MKEWDWNLCLTPMKWEESPQGQQTKRALKGQWNWKNVIFLSIKILARHWDKDFGIMTQVLYKQLDFQVLGVFTWDLNMTFAFNYLPLYTHFMGVSGVRKIRPCQGPHNINSFFRSSISKFVGASRPRRWFMPWSPGWAFSLRMVGGCGTEMMTNLLFSSWRWKGKAWGPSSWSSCNACAIKSYDKGWRRHGGMFEVNVYFTAHPPSAVSHTTQSPLQSRNKGAGSAQGCHLHKYGDFVLQGVLWECAKRQRVCKSC